MDNLGLTEVIYDDEEIRVIWSPNRSKFVLITFGDLVSLAKDHRFFADKPLAKLEISAIGVMAKRKNWYPQASLRKASEYIEAKISKYTCRISYGGSMGGYAAIKFSRLLGATHVIALCPQWSIDPKECEGTNPGWAKFFEVSMTGMGIRASDVAGEVFLFVDAFDAHDMFHCKAIVANYPDAHFINVPSVGHHVTTVFAGTVNAQDLIEACLAGDIKALRAISRRTRRSHSIWQGNLLDRAMRKFPGIAIRFLLNSANSAFLRKDWRYFTYVFSHLAKTGDSTTALAFYQRSSRMFSDPAEQQLICAYLVDLFGGRVAICTAHGSWLIYDLSENRLVHKSEPLQPSDFPVEIEVFGSTVTLFISVGGTRFPLSVAANGSIIFANSQVRQEVRSVFEFQSTGNERFTVSQGGKYLSAQRLGVVLCDRDIVFAWEMFHFGYLATPAVRDPTKYRHLLK